MTPGQTVDEASSSGHGAFEAAYSVDAPAPEVTCASWIQSSAGYFFTLTALCGLMDARRVLFGQGQALSIDIGKIDFLLLFEWGWIIAFATRLDFSRLRAGLAERALGFVFGAYALFVVAPESHIWTIILCLLIAARIAPVAALRPLALCLILAGLQFLPGHSSLEWLNQISIGVDVRATHWLLLAAGYANQFSDATVWLSGATHAILVNNPCDTLTALSPALCAYGVFVLCGGGRLDTGFWRGLAVLAPLIFALNWLRLCGMTLSLEYYSWLHSGAGASILSMIYAVAAFQMAEAAIRRSRASPAVAPVASL